MKAFNYTVGAGSQGLLKNNHPPADNSKHNDYGTLGKALTKHLKKKKRKDSIRLQLELENTVRRQIENQQRWHSMDKLVVLNREKNQEIKRHIYEKAALESKNEELKAMMAGPTQREQDLQRKINELEVQIVKMRSEFEQKQLKYKQQIEEMKRMHRKEVNLLEDNHQIEINRISKTISPSRTVTAEKEKANTYQAVPESRDSRNSPTRVVNVYNPSSTVNYSTRQQSPVKKSEFQNIRTIPVTQHNNQNQNSYTNVFSQNSTRHQYQTTASPLKREMPADHKDRNLSPNTTKNTTYTSNYDADFGKRISPLRGQLERTGLSSQQYNSSLGNGQAYPYRNVNQKVQTRNSSSSRPATFGTQQGKEGNQKDIRTIGRTGTSSVTTQEIDDICKKYYLND